MHFTWRIKERMHLRYGMQMSPLTCHRQFEGPRNHQPFGGRERHRLLPHGLELHYRCMEIVAFSSQDRLV